MEKRAETVAVVEHGRLVYVDRGQQITVDVGTAPWYAWLETAMTFTFVEAAGTFIAHKARAGNRRGGWYWRAYLCRHGRIFRRYLGISSNVTVACLREAAQCLVLRAEDGAYTQSTESAGEVVQAAPSSGVLASLPVIKTKCVVPRLPVVHVPRTRLVEHLERSALFPLTLVSAPAGSGKTTLLAEWARATKLPVAWLSLEAAESDPVRFLAYLLSALRELDERVGREFRTLASTPPASNLEDLLSLLSNDLSRYLTTDAVLVLDDCHVLTSEVVHAALLFLLEHLPEHLHLVLGTRVDPPLPLARLRVHGQLSELHTDTLRFTTLELNAFLHAMGVALAEGELNDLEERTEGWIAGVQLAALALQGQGDPTAFLREFRGNNRLILEYLGEEVLARQTPQVSAFLLQTSVLERLSGSLCDALMEQTGSQAMLEELRRANLFVSALDETGVWYRYHPLFAEGLRHQLRQREPRLFSEVCRRASAWYETHGMLFEACEYALQAGDYERAAPLVGSQVHGLFSGQVTLATLRRWLGLLPPQVVSDHLLLGVAATWVLFAEDDASEELTQMIARLQRDFQARAGAAEHAEWTEARAYFDFTLMMQALSRKETARALELAQQMLQALPGEAVYVRHFASLAASLGQGTHAYLRGDFAAAERILGETGAQMQALGYHLLNMIAISLLVEMYEAQGELQKIVQLYQQPLRMLRSMKVVSPELAAYISMAYARLLREWNRLDEAEDLLAAALIAEPQNQIRDLSLSCLLIQQGIMQARGRYAEALQLLHQVEEAHPGKDVALLADLASVRLLLGQEKVDEALIWLRESGLHFDDPLPEQPDELCFARYITVVRVLIAQGRRSVREPYLVQARTLLERLAALYEPLKLTGRVIEILILTALALQAQGETPHALATLRRAIILAEPSGYVRLFVDEGASMARLFARLSFQRPASAVYLRTLRAAAGLPEEGEPEARRASLQGSASLPGPLSTRESEVLALLAAGASNREIAARLVIAPNTAKRHVKHILAKLVASNRTQAVTRARELHLL